MQNFSGKSWPLATGGNFWQQNEGQDVVTLQCDSVECHPWLKGMPSTTCPDVIYDPKW